jgi:hypothetical protein
VRAFQQVETTSGPVAVDGRTITLVARSRAVRVGGERVGVMHVWSRPSHVEVLDGDGTRQVVRIRDVQRIATAAIMAAAGACVLGVELSRRHRRS